MKERIEGIDGTGPRTGWHALETGDALSRLGSSEAGLSREEAAARLARVGPNVVARPEGPGLLGMAARQLRDPLILLLLVSAAVAGALGKLVDGAVVLGAVVINAALGVVQEWRAGRAISALSRMVPEIAVAVRGGERAAIPAAMLVPGDVVALAPGDRVPADARVVSARSLHADESALTGESVPVSKSADAVSADAPLGDRRSVVHAGTHVTSGTGTALVVATGGETELGRISAMLGGVVEIETPLTRALARVGRGLTAAVLAAAVVLLAVGLARGWGLPDALLAAVAIAVAAVPEGLPAVITISLAIGVQRMARRRALVRHLPSVETLGSTTVICTDKTGTLTRNEMTVQKLWTPSGGEYELSGVGYAPQGTLARAGIPLERPPTDVEEALRAAALCNDASVHRDGAAWRIAGDPTEAALVTAADKAGVAVEPSRARWARLDVIPFESDRRFMATLHRDPAGGRRVFVKGAPEVVLRRCDGTDGARAEHFARALAAEGMRVLALAERRLADGGDGLRDEDAASGLTLLGMAGMIDPPRPEAISAVSECHAAGITVKMITGDHAGTAEAIGARVGLRSRGAAVEGSALARMDDASLARAVRETNVFARVAAEHKLRLVRALQGDGEVVAMTGDGVNDAPALKQADVGVAMGVTGTAVAKEAADVVLADDDFATIAAAVEEGRRIYDNLVKALAFVLPTNLGLGLVLVAAVVASPVAEVGGVMQPLLPVLPTQLLWVNFVASIALSVTLAFEVKERDLMRRPPRPPDAPVFGAFVVVRTAVVAVLMAAAALGLFLWEYHTHAEAFGREEALREARTMVVTTIVFFQMFYLLNCRSLRDSVFRIGLFSNRAVFLGIGALAALQAAFVYLPPMQRVFGNAPLDARSLALAAAAGAIVLPIVTVEKRLRAGGSARARGRVAAPGGSRGDMGGRAVPARDR